MTVASIISVGFHHRPLRCSFASVLLVMAVLVVGSPVCSAADEAPVPAWNVPAGWQKLEGQRPMRFATFRAGEQESATDVVVSHFPGDVGGLLANVNRWRQQVGLDPVTPATLPEVVTPFENPGFSGHTMRLKGAEQHMLAAAIFDTQGQRTWFVKITATPAIIDQQEAAFLAFVKSFAPAK
jgi:hypothetical protein